MTLLEAMRAGGDRHPRLPPELARGGDPDRRESVSLTCLRGPVRARLFSSTLCRCLASCSRSIVVDDAIVVVEKSTGTSRKPEPLEAARRSMDEVSTRWSRSSSCCAPCSCDDVPTGTVGEFSVSRGHHIQRDRFRWSYTDPFPSAGRASAEDQGRAPTGAAPHVVNAGDRFNRAFDRLAGS